MLISVIYKCAIKIYLNLVLWEKVAIELVGRGEQHLSEMMKYQKNHLLTRDD